jgi:type II secretory pathway component PulC
MGRRKKTHGKRSDYVTRAFYLILIVAWATGCGAASTDLAMVDETSLSSDPEGGETVPDEICVGEPKIMRRDLDELLANGPAYVLALVQSDSHKVDGRFVGFRIVSFRVDLDPCIDLREDDVVTLVNGKSIERPEHYFEVFETLKTAHKVQFDILRDGVLLVLTYPVVD